MPGGEEDLADLRTEVLQLKQELKMHRKVLEECLQVRDGCVDLLSHREALNHCFELQDASEQPGHVALASERLDRIEHRVIEDQELLKELDLSLAGVSDNTAKQGKAITALMEQQKCTSATLDAVVRAVKRLDRSRSRPPVEVVAYPEPELPKVMPINSVDGASTAGGATDCLPEDGCSEAVANEEEAQGTSPDGWLEGEDEPEGEAYGSEPYGSERFPSETWGWNGWRREYCEDPEDFRYTSTGSSCGSEGRLWQRHSARSSRAMSTGHHRRPFYPKQGGFQQASQTGPMSEMADCAQGVLARIEEALAKLDGTPQGGLDRSLRPEIEAMRRQCGRAGSAGACVRPRPHVAYTPRGRAPQGYGCFTPR